MASVRDLRLYNHGMAYITREARCSGEPSLDLQFKEREMNDILKSLMIVDRGRGRVAGLSYQTSEDIDRQIEEKALRVSGDGTVFDLLSRVCGSRIELRVGKPGEEGVKIFGRILGVQERASKLGIGVREQVLILLPSGEVHFVDLPLIRDVRLEDHSAYSDLRYYMDSLVSRGKKSTKGVTLFLDGDDHELDISFIAQMAPWRMSYRLFFSPDETTLQCWGIVDNTLDEDLDDIRMTLISGKPISFIYDLYLAQTVKRQRIKEEVRITTAPVELEAEKRTLEKGELELAEMREQLAQRPTMAAAPMEKMLCQESMPPPAAMAAGAGSEMSEAMSMARGMKAAKRKRAKMMERDRGEMDLRMADMECAKKEMAYCDDLMLEDECEEEPGFGYTADIGGLISEFEDELLDEDLPEREATEVEDYAEGAESTVVSAEAVKLPEFFQYEITSPVTIRRGQSAMVPILQEKVECTREMVYNRLKTGRHPLIVMRLENRTGVRLERGPITILDRSEYAGEGILPAMDPGSEVRVAYAIATGVRVKEENRAKTGFREIERKGADLIYRENHDEVFGYVIENDSLEMAEVVIEHPRSDSHKLHEMEPPFEVSGDFFRWKITVKPKREVSFKVSQREVLKEVFPILSRTMEIYKEYHEDGKLSGEELETLREIHLMNERIDSHRHNLGILENQEANMIGYMGVLGDIMGNLEFGEGEMNLRNRLVEKYLEAEYRLTKLRGAILDIRGDLKYLRKALDHIYWPEKSPDFRYERPEAVKNLAELLREQTVQHWYNRSANAVRAAVKRE